MEKIINYENLSSFAYSNDKLICEKAKGIVINFFGLGGAAMYPCGNAEGERFAKEGIIYITPYTNPWGWMNRDEVGLSDEIIDVIKEKYGEMDVVAIGGSMGGLASIVYTAYTRHTPVGCVANCPVCDLVYHFTERVDLPRTLYSAFYSYEGTMNEALMSASPLHLIDKLPKKTKYTVFHCTEDSAVNIDKHSEKFILEMRKTREIDYIRVEGKDHCDLGAEAYESYIQTAIKYLTK